LSVFGFYCDFKKGVVLNSDQEVMKKIESYQKSRHKAVSNLAKRVTGIKLLNRLLLQELEKVDHEESKKAFKERLSSIESAKERILQKSSKTLYAEKLKNIDGVIKLLKHIDREFEKYSSLLSSMEEELVYLFNKIRETKKEKR